MHLFLARGLTSTDRGDFVLQHEEADMVTFWAPFAELRAAREVFDERLRLAEALVRDATPSLADNESLSRRSYEAGEMSLMDYLLIRRDALDTRTEIVGRRHDAALARLTVDFLAGVLR